MEKLNVSEIKETVSANPGSYILHGQISGIHRKLTKTNKPYFEIEITDSTGSLKLKAWQDSKAFTQSESLQGNEWVKVQGHWSNNEYGIDARDWEIQELEPKEVEETLAGDERTKEKQSEDYEYIKQLCHSLGDPRLRTLCLSFLERFGDRFRRSAGARNLHHARRGGLVEHVAQMMRAAEALSDAYTILNKDLLITGVLFHDCGKMWENSFPADSFTMPYDSRAELMGHISIGTEIANTLWREIDTDTIEEWKLFDPPSEKVRIHLIHLILSHHGKIEYGSPVLPKTPEAIALHHIDNIDAKLEMIFQGYEEQEPLSEEVYSKVWALESNIVKPLEKFDG